VQLDESPPITTLTTTTTPTRRFRRLATPDEPPRRTLSPSTLVAVIAAPTLGQRDGSGPRCSTGGGPSQANTPHRWLTGVKLATSSTARATSHLAPPRERLGSGHCDRASSVVTDDLANTLTLSGVPARVLRGFGDHLLLVSMDGCEVVSSAARAGRVSALLLARSSRRSVVGFAMAALNAAVVVPTRSDAERSFPEPPGRTSADHRERLRRSPIVREQAWTIVNLCGRAKNARRTRIKTCCRPGQR
jgi:hypothetical protein